MARRTPAAGLPAGLLLLRAGREPVVRWAARGLVPVDVVPAGEGWSLVVPTSESSAASPPYDDAIAVLLNRPLPSRLLPAVGLALRDEDALICVTPKGIRATRRWLAWHPGVGVTHPGGLPMARLSDLVKSAGLDDPEAVAGLADVLHDPQGDARQLLLDVLVALDLPGGQVLDGSLSAASEGVRVEPDPRTVGRFDSMVQEDVSWRDEMEGQHP